MNCCPKLKHEDYTIGWICALPDPELTAAIFMLDEEHERLEQKDGDPNTYKLGRIDRHNVTITCLGNGTYGVPAAANVASNLSRSFPNVKVGLMCGIAGGAPSDPCDIRLGDVVVATPNATHGGVISYRAGKLTNDPNIELKGHLGATPQILQSAIGSLRADDRGLTKKARRDGLGFPRHLKIEAIEDNEEFQHLGQELDRLYDGDTDVKVERCRREHNHPLAFYGTIGSADTLMKNAKERDRLRDELGILCFEMEAAGLMNHFPCAVIRGICDYADSHKNKKWQSYAAVTAAAYAKELLTYVPEVSALPPAMETLSSTSPVHSRVIHHGNNSSGGIGVYGNQSFSGSHITIGSTYNYE